MCLNVRHPFSHMWCCTIETWDHKCHFCLFIDDYTQETYGVQLHTKDKTFSEYKVYTAWDKSHRGITRIKFLPSDNGKECMDRRFQAYLGTIHCTTVHDTHTKMKLRTTQTETEQLLSTSMLCGLQVACHSSLGEKIFSTSST